MKITLIILIIIFTYFYFFNKDKLEFTEQIKKEGGCRAKYSLLIDSLLVNISGLKIIENKPLHVVLNRNDGTFELTYYILLNSENISIRLNIKEGGAINKKSWEYNKSYSQDLMFNEISNHTEWMFGQLLKKYGL